MRTKDTFLWRPPSDLKSRLEVDAKEKGLSLTGLLNVISKNGNNKREIRPDFRWFMRIHCYRNR